MIRVFDFTCSNGHTTEHFTSHTQEEIKCPVCSSPAFKQISSPSVKLEGWSGSFPGAAMKWEKNRRAKMAQERKQNS
jgi:hypothetical protein